MRFSARLLLIVVSICLFFNSFVAPVAAQTASPAAQSTTTYDQFRTPNVDASVPRDNHTYTQTVVIDVLSALVCQLTGIDPTNPHQACLGINPQTGKIGMVPNQEQMAANGTPQIGGALGLSTSLIGGAYTQSVSSTQYFHYLADNFGLVKPAIAAAPPSTVQEDCSGSIFGYGFCGLKPIFTLWKSLRDASYGLLTLIFIALGLGVMLRFKVDPRTVMTLQNQIPRVIIAIILITFSYGIAGAMIDLMWTVTYAGISIISNAAPDSKIAMSCQHNAVGLNSSSGAGDIKPISSVGQLILDQPISFANTLFLRDCKGNIGSGIINISSRISDSVRGLVTGILDNLFGWNPDGAGNSDCGILHPVNCFAQFGLWITQLIVIAIIIIAILIALFRLWFELVKTYITILIFVIMGPIWIIFGLIPGRPLGFEKWIRIMFANLAAYPLVAFILIFGRVMVDAIPAKPDPSSIFIPPLIGNPNMQAFSVFMGFGAIMLAPTIPGMIKERMKAKGSGNYGKTIAAGIGFAAGAATSPGKKMWESLNHRNSSTGAPEGSLAVAKQKAWQKTPYFGRRAIAKKSLLHEAHQSGDYTKVNRRGIKEKMGTLKTGNEDAKYDRRAEKIESLQKNDQDQSLFRRMTSTPASRQARAERLQGKQDNSPVQARRATQGQEAAAAEQAAQQAREAEKQADAERLARAVQEGLDKKNKGE